MATVVDSNSHVPQRWSFPKGATLVVALGALLLLGASLGVASSRGVFFGKFAPVAKQLADSRVYSTLFTVGGLATVLGLASLGYRQAGNRLFQPASLSRKIGSMCKVPVQMWRSRKVRGQIVPKGTRLAALGGGPSWARMGPISGPQQMEFMAQLTPSLPVDYGYYMGTLPECKAGRVVLHLVVESKGVIAHGVALYINTTTGEAEYYDPKGLLINERAEQRVRHSDQKLPAFVASVLEHYLSGVKPKVYETGGDQNDHHSCGVRVCRRSWEWLGGRSAYPIRDEIGFRQEVLKIIGHHDDFPASQPTAVIEDLDDDDE